MMSYTFFMGSLKAGVCCGYGMHVLQGVTSRWCSSFLEPVSFEPLQKAKERLAQKYGMEEQVDLFEGCSYPLARSAGSALFRVFRKAIYLDEKLVEIDPLAALWSIHHEMCLLKNNSNLSRRIATLAPALLLFSFCSFPVALCGTVATHVMISKKMDDEHDMKASRLAFQNADVHELQGAVRLLQAEVEAQKEYLQRARKSKCLQIFTSISNCKEKQLEEAIEALKNRFHFATLSIDLLKQDYRVNLIKNRILELVS
jgi:hypothetical protein